MTSPTSSPERSTGPDAIAATRAVTRRYLLLHGLRWAPTGLLIPITVLLFTSRGFSLAEFGILGTVLGTTTFLLELPTGGLADALGRKRVLLVASGFVVLAKGLLAVIAWSPDRPAFALAISSVAAMGIYRALESGPLDAWYVDAIHAVDRRADVEGGLGRAETVTGFAIAAGSLAAGGILTWDPLAGVDPMALVVLVSLGLVVLQGVVLALLMDDPREPLGRAALTEALRDAPRVVTSTLSLARTNRVLGLLLAVEATWSVGMVSFENLLPVRLEALSGSSDAAAALLGPASAAAWAASGAGAGLVIHRSRRLGPYRTAALLRVVQAATILVMGLVAGVAGAITGLIATYFVHGASAPVHYALLHRQVDAGRRATVLSLNSMVAFATFSVAGISIGALADGWTVPAAIVVCAVVTAIGGIFPLLARRHDPDPRGVVLDEEDDQATDPPDPQGAHGTPGGTDEVPVMDGPTA